MPTYQHKTKDELIKELQKLQLKYDSLKVSFERDITERKQVAAAFRKLSLRQEAILAAVPEIIMEVDKNKIYTWANCPGLNFFGDDVIGKEASFYFEGDEVTYDMVKPLFNGNEGIFYMESWQRRYDGEKRLLAWWCKVLKDKEGNVTGALSSARDITERKLTEDALCLEKENFRRLMDDSPLGKRITTIEGETIYANKALLDLYGYNNLEELQNTPLKKRYTPESYIQAQARKRQRKQGDFSTTDYEVSITRENGEIRHLQVWRKEIIWDGVNQFQIICNDITERRHAEEEIRKSKELMENLHKHLNEILENERALMSREIHDQIGQSLTALKLDLNWMHKYINTNQDAVAKLKGMIELVSNTTKDIQRISSDLRPGILDDLGLAAAIEWYSEEFEKRTGIRCRLNLDDSIPADPQKDLVFFRVLQEALTNIIRHASASSVRIKLSRIKNGIAMSIQDNGKGMLPGIAKSGKSLGLIGMRERVRQFGGKIDIVSKKGEGTKLTIFIPF